jgi:1-acyl-sn-glycerol-3-phosphate acyltransferase
MAFMVDPEVEQRVRRIEIPFNRYGYDPYGVSRKHLTWFYSLLKFFYRSYFRVKTHGIENVPARGRAMLIGNHSGSLPVDGGMVLASLLLEHDPPRHVHGMVEKFAESWPFVSEWFNRIGQFMLMVFPEGARGTGKLYKDRYKLVRFGTGFMRLALQSQSPIVPFAFIGGEEALPAMFHLDFLAKMVGAPYWPVPPHIVPVPLPVPCELYYGEPMTFEGDGTEPDEVIEEYVGQVRQRIRELIAKGLESRGGAA